MRAKMGLSSTVPFRNYVDNIGTSQESKSVRPADWLPMPSITEGEYKIAILVPVYNDEDILIATNKGWPVYR